MLPLSDLARNTDTSQVHLDEIVRLVPGVVFDLDVVTPGGSGGGGNGLLLFGGGVLGRVQIALLQLLDERRLRPPYLMHEINEN